MITYRLGDNFEDFIFKAKTRLLLKKSVHLIVEPGDATHYEIAIVWYEDYLIIAVPSKDWSIRWNIFNGPAPHDLPFHNTYTCAVYADLIRIVIGQEPIYYDWQQSCPREIA